MMAARRTTRFIAALALVGLLLGSSPLAPSSLSASAQTISISTSRFCDGLADAIEFLRTRPPTKLVVALIKYLESVQTNYCS